MFKVVTYLGRILRTVKPSGALRGIGKRMSSIFSSVAKSPKSRLTRSVSRAAAGAERVGSLARNSRVGKWYQAQPAWARSAASSIGQFLLLDRAIAWLAPDDQENDLIATDSADSTSAIRAIVEANGHSRLLLMDRMDDARRIMSTSGNDKMQDMISSLFIDRGVSLSGDPITVRAEDIGALSDYERMIIITRLVTISKIIAHSSESPNYMELAMKQAACSDMINSSPTKGFDYFNRAAPELQKQMDDVAASSCDIYSGLFDSLVNAAGMDMFDEQTRVFDWFDATSDPSQVSLTVPFLVSKIMTDDVVGINLPWYKEMTVDSDGADDESAALNLINEYSVISDTYCDYVRRSVSGDIRADYGIQ